MSLSKEALAQCQVTGMMSALVVSACTTMSCIALTRGAFKIIRLSTIRRGCSPAQPIHVFSWNNNAHSAYTKHRLHKSCIRVA